MPAGGFEACPLLRPLRPELDTHDDRSGADFDERLYPFTVCPFPGDAQVTFMVRLERNERATAFAATPRAALKREPRGSC